jgi:transposase InsO family protein
LTIHADRGSSMRSKPVSQLLIDLGVARSHSRPHVCLFTGYSVYANAERSSRNALQLAA